MESIERKGDQMHVAPTLRGRYQISLAHRKELVARPAFRSFTVRDALLVSAQHRSSGGRTAEVVNHALGA